MIMKKIKYIVVSVLIMFSFTLAAQSEDPFRTVSGTSGTLKVPETTSGEAGKTTTIVVKSNDRDKKDIEILDPNSNNVVDKIKIQGILSVELVSLVGDIASQTVELTILFSNHQTNRTIVIHSLTAYDNLGDANNAYGASVETFTDVPIKQVFKFRTKVLPSKVSKMNVIKIPFSGIRDVEFRNIEIDWR